MESQENGVAAPREMSEEQQVQDAINRVQGAFQGLVDTLQKHIEHFPALNMPVHYLFPRIKEGYQWLLNSCERDNFTYLVTERNQKHLGSLISLITGVSYEQVRGYFREVLESKEFQESYNRSVARYQGKLRLDPTEMPRIARRLGWYAMVRILKPKCVMETGVHYGLGAMVLGLALEKNQSEGHEGQYIGVDIVGTAGILFKESPYSKMGQVYTSDSIEFINNYQGKVDLLVVDSDHSAEYEYREYHAACKILSDKAMILGDNAHSSDSLHQFSLEKGRKFAFFREDPEEHWYPGAGIGFSF
jgi:predicted O-methyltransferase YrrM